MICMRCVRDAIDTRALGAGSKRSDECGPSDSCQRSRRVRPRLVRNGENGFAFKAGDVSDLSRVLREVLVSPARYTEMGRNSLDIIKGWSFEEDVVGLRIALGI